MIGNLNLMILKGDTRAPLTEIKHLIGQGFILTNVIFILATTLLEMGVLI